MSNATPTRSAVLEMKDDRRAMHDGYVFLDEKCLLLAGEMLRELARYRALRAAHLAAWRVAVEHLQEAVGRHGLHGLQVYPPADGSAMRVACRPRSLMGVKLLDAELAGEPGPGPEPLERSQEADACRLSFAAVLAAAAPLAAVSGNLVRLALEYRRSVRRARALQDVLLPELDRSLADLETRLEELEQEDAIFMRHGRV
jgi:V/A-type H+-transporting ATPase subunit D